MGYKKIKFEIKEEISLLRFLSSNLKLDNRKIQKYISKGRFSINNEVITKPNVNVKGILEFIDFIPNSNNILPIFESEDLCFFDKPSGVYIHPTNRDTEYSLLDDIHAYIGKSAYLGHRIDKETSGLVLVSKSKNIDIKIKQMFENREISKEYLAIVFGHLTKEYLVQKPLIVNKDYDKTKDKMLIDENGLKSETKIVPIKYDINTNTTLVKAIPYTGRTHQIRVHLNYIGFPILGEPLYGKSFEIAKNYLDNRLNNEDRIKQTGSYRVQLHSHRLQFNLNNQNYNIKSDFLF